MEGTREWRHERVLDCSLPALPRDSLGEGLEDDPEVGPDHRADQQRRGRAFDVEMAAGCLPSLGDEHDRQGVGHRPEEECELPPAVALDQVRVSLDHAHQADELAPEWMLFADDHELTSSSSSSSSSS